jgi:hypothetical protein
MSTLIKILSATIIIAAPALAAYAPEEMCVIPWGDSANQLKIGLPNYEDVNFTPADSSDDFVGTAGPSQGVVDKSENCYFTSHHFMQFKGFGRDSHRIFDYSKGEPEYNGELFKSAIRNIYVDSMSNIYVVDGTRYDYISIVDTTGHLLEKISPHEPNSGIIIYNFYPNSNDILTIGCKDRTFYTYQNGEIRDGGNSGWKAIDGYYYTARFEDSAHLTFVKYRDPDIHGVLSDLEETTIAITDNSPYDIEFLGVDNDMNLYLYLIGPRPSDGRVLVYDTAYNLKEEIIFAQERNQYMWYMAPYMRPSDGNIYEFRCLDDGLHVIRWSKK